MTAIVTDAVAGPFRATYAGPSGSNPSTAHLGVIGARGIRQIRRFEGEEFAASLSGRSAVDGVYLGGQMFLEFELEEANLAGVLALTNPFGATALGSIPAVAYDNEMGVPGTFMSTKAGSLILNPLYSKTGTIHTTAGSQTTPVRTYGIVTIAAGFEQELKYHSERRTIPVRLRCFPYSDGGTPPKYIWYSVGAVDANYYVD